MMPKPVSKEYLYDWYQNSVLNDEPIWTDDHIEELFKDFHCIPKSDEDLIYDYLVAYRAAEFCGDINIRSNYPLDSYDKLKETRDLIREGCSMSKDVPVSIMNIVLLNVRPGTINSDDKEE